MILKWRRRKGIIFMVFITVVYVLHVITKEKDVYQFVRPNIRETCKLPNIDPFDPSILKYIHKSPPIVCDKSPSLVFVNSSGFLQINKTAVASAGYQQVVCSFSTVQRLGDFDISFGPEVTLFHPTYIPADFFRVKCNADDVSVYDYMHHSIDYRHTMRTNPPQDESEDQLSVYMVGFDSVSRLAAERKLPKTMAYIRNDLKGYIMKGYTKVEENTFPNALAFLTGKKPYSSELPPYKEILDPYPFIWNNFSTSSYVTFLAEDCVEMPTFQYWKGFNIKPCRHYMRPYHMAIDRLQAYKNDLDKVFMFFESKNIKFRETSALCYGNTARHQLVINYYKQFIESYGNKLKFGLSWLTELGHTYNDLIELADSDILNFFTWMKETGKLRNAVLIFLSDHGVATSDIRNTPVGRIENRMPILGIVIPETLKSRYPHIHRNLLLNTERLSSPFDLYETMVDIANKNFDQTHFRRKRGISFFREIPASRSCFEAGIEKFYCPCDTVKPLSVREPIVKRIAEFILHTINEYVSKVEKDCSKLKITNIFHAAILESGFHRTLKSGGSFIKKSITEEDIEKLEKYLVVIQTVPGNGMFEAMVEKRTDNSFNLLGHISRSNRYGNQSFCVEKSLRPYCYCTVLDEQ